MTQPSPVNRRFLHWQGFITGREALRRFPDPAFFMRPSASQSVDELRDVLLRNADEAARVTEMLRQNISWNKKQPILYAANKLHDFRVSLNIHGGEQGRPYLWEE